MKINLIRKQSPPAVAYLCQNYLQLSLLSNSEIKLVRQDLHNDDFNQNYQDVSDRLDVAVNTKPESKIIIILADGLVLYSQRKLPSNLSNEEIAELISIQQSQHHSDSDIQTYYDYFLLNKLKESVVLGLFEARQDKLNWLIRVFEYHGFSVSLMIPQLLVIVNQIISNQSVQLENYHIIYNLNRQVFVVHVNNKQVTELNQIHIDMNSLSSAISAEINTYLSQVQAEHVITVGFNKLNFKNQSENNNGQIIRFESISVSQNLVLQTIDWVREQYDMYKSIALA